MALVACQPSSDDGPQKTARAGTPVLHYFTWSDYVDQQLLDGFERATGAKVMVDTFASNEELLAKLQSGATGYDVAAPSDFMVSIMLKQGLLAELDQRQIPNASALEKWLQHLPFDPEQRYAIPYMWGTVGIGYDATVVTSPPDSWEALWDPKYRGRISMLNDQREVFGVALRVLGQSMNMRDPRVIERAKKKLLAQKPLLKAYASENYDQMLASGDVVLAHGWGGQVARAMRERPSIRYVVPKEGGTIWADCLVVLRASTQKDLAMQFINYLLDQKVAAETSNRLLFATANREARALVDENILQNPAIFPPEDVLDRLEWLADVGDAIRHYDRAWTELKMH